MVNGGMPRLLTICHFYFQLDGKQAGQLTEEDENKLPESVKAGA